MNCEKLNALAATRIMGWMWITGDANFGIWGNKDGTSHHYSDQSWNPAQNNNDAMMLLKAATFGGSWQLFYSARRGTYGCYIQGQNGNRHVYGDTAALAMTLCALYARGVSKIEIQEATQ